VAAALLACVAPAAPAQTPAEDPVAVLATGPVRERSIPVLPPNIIEYQRAVYELSEDRVEVLFTEQPVFRGEAWTDTACDGFALALLPESHGRTLYYEWPDGRRHAFFRFGAVSAGGRADEDTGLEARPAECAFIEPFLERFSFFLETADPARAAPFPAVLPRE
jgi:hypothetical protein